MAKKSAPVSAFMHTTEDNEYSRQLPRKKDDVSIQKGAQKQKWLVLCNLHEFFVPFKHSHKK